MDLSNTTGVTTTKVNAIGGGITVSPDAGLAPESLIKGEISLAKQSLNILESTMNNAETRFQPVLRPSTDNAQNDEKPEIRPVRSEIAEEIMSLRLKIDYLTSRLESLVVSAEV